MSNKRPEQRGTNAPLFEVTEFSFLLTSTAPKNNYIHVRSDSFEQLSRCAAHRKWHTHKYEEKFNVFKTNRPFDFINKSIKAYS